MFKLTQSYSSLWSSILRAFAAVFIAALCIASLATLTGCGEDKQRFVGEWTCELQQLGNDGLAYYVDHTLAINEDDSFEYEIVQWERQSNSVAGTATLVGKWSVKGDVITLEMEDGDTSLTISKDGTTLTDAEGYRFTKQSSD